MKKIIALLCLLALLVVLAGCSEKEPAEPDTQPTTQSTQPTTESTAPTETTTEFSNEPSPSEPELSFGAANVSTFRDEYGTIYAQALITVKNESTVSVQLSQGVMEFMDENGVSVFCAESVMAFPDVLAPGETACYFEQVAPEMADTQALSVQLSGVEATPCADPVRFETDAGSLRTSPYGGLILTGTVTNRTATPQELCCVAAVLYGQDGSPLAVIYTVLMETLEGSSTLDFTIEHYLLPETLTVDAVADYTLFAYPMG